LSSVASELEATDEHIPQLTEEIGQLQAKLNDAKAKQKAIVMRSKTVESRIKVKRQVHRESLDDALIKFERYERKMDSIEGELEAMDLGRSGESGLAAEINSLADDEAIDAELERLKASMGAGESSSEDA
jgi:phage shock protein A